MPTQNRRVATYLPPHIDNRLKEFKSERDIKGDSEALIAVLSEYFQVNQKVAYPSSSNLLQRIEAIEEKLGSLKRELLSELKYELQVSIQPELGKKESESLSELQSKLSEIESSQESSAQLNLISDNSSVQKTFISSLPNDDDLKPLKAAELSRRFGKRTDFVKAMKLRYKDKPAEFLVKLQEADPYGVSWEYREADKLYHPVQ
jgi:hypothetical protein